MRNSVRDGILIGLSPRQGPVARSSVVGACGLPGITRGGAYLAICSALASLAFAQPNLETRIADAVAKRESGTQSALVRAAEELEVIRREHPRSGLAGIELAETCRQLRRFADAVTVAREATAFTPHTARAHAVLGDCLFARAANAPAADRSDHEAAVAAWRQALQLDSTSVELFYKLSNCLLFQLNRRDEAVAVCREGLALHPTAALLHYQHGQCLLSVSATGENAPPDAYEGAIIAFRETVRIAPTNAHGHLALMNALEQAGRREDAITAGQDAVALARTTTLHGLPSGRLHIQLARLHLQGGNRPEAVRVRKELASIDAKLAASIDAEVTRQLSAAYPDGGVIVINPTSDPPERRITTKEEAEAAVGKGGALHMYVLPSAADTAFERAHQAAEAGLTEDALAEYREAIRLRPSFAEAHLNLGNLEVKLGRIDSAIENYETAIRAKPGLGLGHYLLGIALEKRGNRAAAISAYQEAVRHSPHDARFLFNLGNTCLRAKRFEEAAEALEKCVAIDAKDERHWLTLGMTYLFLGRRSDASTTALRARVNGSPAADTLKALLDGRAQLPEL